MSFGTQLDEATILQSQFKRQLQNPVTIPVVIEEEPGDAEIRRRLNRVMITTPDGRVIPADADRKDTKGKPVPLKVPYEAIKAWCAISDFGFAKHGDRDSWYRSTDGVNVYSNACARHLFAGPDQIDPESGLPHCYAVLWNAVAVVWHYEREKDKKF